MVLTLRVGTTATSGCVQTKVKRLAETMSKQGKFSVESRVQQVNADKKASDQADPK